MNVQHRTSNIERRILMAQRFIDFEKSEPQPAARGPSAGGRSILTILLILSNCFLKIRIHSSFLQSIVIDGNLYQGSLASYLLYTSAQCHPMR
ncbi:MAG: hypothetical protein WCB15_01495, partial [Desulfobacterales bacterium]